MNVSVDSDFLVLRIDLTTSEAESLVSVLGESRSSFALVLLNAIIAAIGKKLAR